MTGTLVTEILADIGITQLVSKNIKRGSIFEYFKKGKDYFLRVVTVLILGGIPFFLLQITEMIRRISLTSLRPLPGWLIPALIILVPLSFVFIVISKLAIVRIIKENALALESFSKSWVMVIKNQARVFSTGFVLVGSSLLLSSVTALTWNTLILRFSGDFRFFIALTFWALHLFTSSFILGFINVGWTLAYLNLPGKTR
jgi:hypothetical protein